MNIRFVVRDGNKILQQEIQDAAVGWRYIDVPCVEDKPKSVEVTRLRLENSLWACTIDMTPRQVFEQLCKELGL